ncbi:MAG: sigma-54 dependent transcriptional regulator [Gemmataceae bacterium]|nr:sigma-54 dependent transcriptional regulator [Gemmataceae bacterium]MCI0741346.1 sigma-54 dependent transcriptional regulator [Gemmataceae bacterium]
MQRRILIAEDSDKTRQQLQTLLEAESRFEVVAVADGSEALKALEKKSYSIFLTDFKMPGMDGLELIEEVRRREIPVSVIVMTGFGSVDKAVEAMRLGAVDFLTKPVDADHLLLVIDRALRERGLMDELVQLRLQLQDEFSFQNILSRSPRMHAMFEMIKNVAATTTTVLIEGETGTGKEQVAHAIHEASKPLRKGEMIAFNCAAMPENLLESELFGHEKGAFTSAISQRVGRFELADGGTLFLDEVGDIPQPMQAKLLRVLQERRFERVGGTTPIEVDVRVIAATNRSLERLVRKGRFREDLFYRLNVVKMELPPLRERMMDVPLLATHFARKYARPGEPPKNISPAAMERLLAFSWPGNIRQLENCIERACVTCRGAAIEPDDLAPEIMTSPKNNAVSAVDLSKPLPAVLNEATATLERQYLIRALKKSRGNVSRCAKICGLSRRSVTAKLAEYQIQKDEFKE